MRLAGQKWNLAAETAIITIVLAGLKAPAIAHRG